MRRRLAQPRTPADRLEALSAAQAELGLRLDALSAQAAAPEARLQAMAGQLLGLIRDKNATLETALAGLDQLRARLRTLEQMGEPAEARALLATLGGRLDELAAAQAAATAGLEARIAALAPGGVTELADRLARLHESRDAGLEAVLARLQPLEARLGLIEGGREALKRVEARLEALQGESGAARSELAALKAASGAGAALAEQLARLHAQKEALAEALVGRVAAVEAAVAARDPQAALAGVEARLAALGDRLGALENPAETPFAALSEQLAGLHAQKDAGIAAVLTRLAPLEARLAEMEHGLAARDPQAALDRFAERLEVVQGRLASLGDKTPFAELTEQLTGLYAQRDATAEAVFARLAPLEAKLATLDAEARARDPQAALADVETRLAALRDRLGALEGGTPLAELAEQLARLHAQKDATFETVFARLAPLEAKLAALELADPRALLDRFAERLEAVQGRLASLEDKTPLAALTEQLAGLYAQKDATVETVFARLGPLEAKLAALELADPRALLDRFAERLEVVQGRLAAVEDKTPFAALTEQLTGLYAQKDATVETVFARLAPLEAKLAALEGGLARVLPLAEDDPRAAVEGLRARIEALHWAQGEVAAGLAALQAAGAEGGALAGVADQLTRLFAQKDAGAVVLLQRLAPLEARLAELEARPWDPEADAARAEASAIAAQLIAVQAAAEQTALFADRISDLEASLPRLSAARAQAAREAGAPELPGPPTASAPTPAELEAIWTLPRIVSLHHK